MLETKFKLKKVIEVDKKFYLVFRDICQFIYLTLLNLL